MRVISQNGLIDLPYELIGISINHVDKTTIVAYSTGNYKPQNAYVPLAKYSDKKKAEKAMEMLRNEYGKHYFLQGGQMATVSLYVQPFGFIPPKVFRFPQDNEVKVDET